MNTYKNYPGKSAIISYLTENNNKTTKSYWGFLNSYHDTIIISTISTTSISLKKWINLDNHWAGCFLHEGKDIPGLKDKVNTEWSRYAKTLK
ncbi:unnamed protein product [Rhizophagus irregularis]|nr:unnamed protein product [Rhizophagus irregularis]